MLGHSLGEYVAATLAGVLSLEEALALVAARGRLMHSLPPGAMLAVALPAERVQAHLTPALSLAADNGPQASVVAGPQRAIADLQAQLEAQGLVSRRLHTAHAFHSPMLEPILPALLAQLRQVNWQRPQRRYVSNLTGEWITGTQASDPHYWLAQLREVVQFGAGLRRVQELAGAVLLEGGA